jgi:hypothetical protein
MQNLRCNAIFYTSGVSGDGDGPLVYLDHGALCWCGYAGARWLIPATAQQTELLLQEVVINGEPIGPALSKYLWMFSRDYTTGDPNRMYNETSLYLNALPCIYGDPDLVIYSPEWTSPIPADG